ncbi:hypothetical protein Pcinc_038401 [Petrolisthes cinctipes]|uniref:Uncharacterized protein n=1 Tax=Petrolisthes cinctipes TaxID=88211 RepID=A0AAE1EK33_PETCI|nr:hypothetical protein Pcinc_038401 [Petrolisthes cinctipes]
MQKGKEKRERMKGCGCERALTPSHERTWLEGGVKLEATWGKDKWQGRRESSDGGDDDGPLKPTCPYPTTPTSCITQQYKGSWGCVRNRPKSKLLVAYSYTRVTMASLSPGFLHKHCCVVVTTLHYNKPSHPIPDPPHSTTSHHITLSIPPLTHPITLHHPIPSLTHPITEHHPIPPLTHPTHPPDLPHHTTPAYPTPDPPPSHYTTQAYPTPGPYTLPTRVMSSVGTSQYSATRGH